jgi:hypothetical protein
MRLLSRGITRSAGHPRRDVAVTRGLREESRHGRNRPTITQHNVLWQASPQPET